MGFYLNLFELSQGDITKQNCINKMKLGEILDYMLLGNIKNEIVELSRSEKGGKTYF